MRFPRNRVVPWHRALFMKFVQRNGERFGKERGKPIPLFPPNFVNDRDTVSAGNEGKGTGYEEFAIPPRVYATRQCSERRMPFRPVIIHAKNPAGQ